MKRFILKTLWFILPYTFLFLLMIKFYSINKGDLYRIGYIIDLFPSYGKYFEEEFEKPIRYTTISDNPSQKEFTVLAIGDSFSQQPTFGFKNQLAQSIKVLYMDRFISIDDNPVQTLYALARGDFFDIYNVEYVVLESSERAFVERAYDLNKKRIKNISDITEKINNRPIEKLPKYNFFSNQAFIFLYNAFRFLTNSEYTFEEKVHKTKLIRSDLFSVNTNNLLIYSDDMVDAEYNNDLNKIQNLNNILNDLSFLLKKKNVSLIVLPAPDKYSMYFDYIKNKSKYHKPLFLDYLAELNKDYIYIDSRMLLKNVIGLENDIYFYDDTHWTPKAAKIIASDILKKISDR